MKLRSGRLTSSEEKEKWIKLPLELRDMVLESMFKGSEKRVVPIWATVCRDWQIFFERRTFEALTITARQSELDLLRSYVSGHRIRNRIRRHRRFFVRRLIVYVELPRYDCQSCDQEEDGQTIDRNNTTFTDALVHLFTTLSGWGTRANNAEGVSLCLNVRCPSDMEHSSFRPRTMSIQRWREEHGGAALRRQMSKWGRWVRLYCNLLALDPLARLPNVPLVGRFALIQAERTVAPRTMATLMRSLTRAYAVCYEAWDVGFTGLGMWQRLRESTEWEFWLNMSPVVEKVVVRKACTRHTDFRAVCLYALSRSSGHRSLNLINAFPADMFLGYMANMPQLNWPNLEKLLLGCQWPAAYKNWNQMFLAAANAALRMPRLRLLEI